MWHAMRDRAIEVFPVAPEGPIDADTYMKRVESVSVTDAYHSLSIEGFRVSPEFIERVRVGEWDPDNGDDDRDQRNALAARGYFDAFQAVKESVQKVLAGGNAGQIAEQDHAQWYRRLFAPTVTAGILKAADLAGYRSGPVYIRGSKHVPPNREAVRDLMPALFDLLGNESNPAARVVLGHFVFVYIHPYMDGNGRMGRFLMNAMLASGGYPWTIIPVERRTDYMAALEAASVEQNIAIFARFLAGLVHDTLDGERGPTTPLH